MTERTHGRSGYAHGCRCEDCRVAQRDYMREYQRARLAEGKPRSRGVGRQAMCALCRRSFRAHTDMAKYCSTSCASRHTQPGWTKCGPLRMALESGEHADVLRLIASRSMVNQDGCHVWGTLNAQGYPILAVRNKRHMVHRLVLEAKFQKPLGTQSAHHKCANPACVNPDHLQPVTQAENMAEMLARHSYLKRIAELEAALAECSPEHPALWVISVA